MARVALFTATAMSLIFTSAIVKAIQFGETDISLTEGTTRTVYIRRSNGIANDLTMFVFATTIEGYRQRQVAGVSSGCNTNLSTLIGTDESQVDPAEESDLFNSEYSLYFPAQVQEISFELRVANDTIAENEEVFIIYTSIMESPGDRCSGAVTLRDNDVVQFNFSHMSLEIYEGDDLPSMLSIVKTGQNEPNISFRVFVNAGDGSPDEGVDYNANADHTYVFTNETTQLQVATTIVPDRMGESIELIQICLPNLQSPAASVTPTCVTIRILDDDSVIIGYVGSNTSVALVEGGPSATVCIDFKPDGLPLDQFDFIPLTIRPTLLQQGSDQVGFGQESLSFNGPNQVNCITVSAIDDEESDGTHTFQLEIVSLPGNSVPVEFRPGSIPITVVDNDVVSFELIVNTNVSSNDLQELANVLEGDSISRLITIRKSGRSKFTYTVTLSVKTMPGLLDATQMDIILERNIRFVTSANEVDTLDVSFIIPNDAVSERRKQFSISIASIEAFDSNTSTEARTDALTDIQRNAIDITVYDNDFVIGFINSSATIGEELSACGVLCVSILDLQHSDISPKFTIPILVSTFNTSSGVLIQSDEITLNSRNNMNCSEVGYLEDNDKCDQARNFSVQLTWMEDPSYTVSFRQRNITVSVDDGTATRYCNTEGQWEETNVLRCTSVKFIRLELLAQEAIDNADPVEQLMQLAQLTEQLIEATQPQDRSLLPNDLQASTRILTIILQVLQNNDNATANLNVIDIFDNLLDSSQTDGWRILHMAGQVNGSEMLLNSAEQYGLLVALSSNGSNSEESVVRQSRLNIVVTGNQYSEPPSSAIEFPIAADLVNYTKNIKDASEITIPPSLVQERMEKMDNNETLPVFFLLMRDLPMGVFSSNTSTILPTTCTSRGSRSTAATDVLAAQVGMGNSDLGSSQTLQNDPVFLNFSFASVENGSLYRCVYWNFSQPIGNGSWVIAGVTTTDVTTSANLTSVQCVSTHLTSFAVLVDVAGGLQDLGDAERTALQIVSYIGCAISIICLSATVIFFLFQGKKLKTHYFVHLNLAFTLLLAFVVFVAGVETAVGSTGGCAFVAALLHYLFLSAFCWMLCEGIMLYLLLIVVFSSMSKKWWPFLLIGYVPPLPIVVITVGIRYQYYGVRDNCGDLLYCWLSVERGTIFGFVAPMLAITLINVVFLIMALYTLFKTKNRQYARKQEQDDSKNTIKTASAILTASIVLLPLLGLTWMFGILTINANSTAFAWLFTIFNSLQGVFIFIFHVVRSDQVWSKVIPRLKKLRQFTNFRPKAKSYSVSSAGTSTLTKGSNLKSTTGTLSRDTDSSLGRSGDTLKKQDLSTSQTSVGSRSFVELKTDLSPVSEADESVVENETKIDLSLVEDGRVVANKEKKAKQTELNECMSESGKQKMEQDQHGDSPVSPHETEKLEKSEIKDTEENTSDSEEIFNPTAVAGTPKMNKSDASAKVEASKCKGEGEYDKPEKAQNSKLIKF